MYDQIRSLKTEIEENLSRADNGISLKTDGDTETCSRGAEKMWPCADPGRWDGVRRDYGVAEMRRLTGSIRIRHTLAEMGARKLWKLLQTEDYVPTFGAFTGNQAVQHAKAGLKAIYLSGWQVAADANSAGAMY